MFYQMISRRVTKMKENKANICAFLCIAMGCILLTYTVSVFNLGWTYLANDFLLAIFSGISASSFVVLFTELIKYNLNKKILKKTKLLLMLILFLQMLPIFKNFLKTIHIRRTPND